MAEVSTGNACLPDPVDSKTLVLFSGSNKQLASFLSSVATEPPGKAHVL